MNIGRTGKYYYLRLLRLKGSPHSLALGSAIGVFVGITPTIPLHTIIIFILCIFTRSSFIAAIITSWLVCNPLTYIPQYYLSTKIGNLVTPYELSWDKIKSVLNVLLSDSALGERISSFMTLGYESAIILVAGGCLLALPFTIFTYYSSYIMFVKIKKKRREKQILY